jgi:phosphatidylglycerophosphate synthase
MSKLEEHQDHPLELVCYQFAEKISPFFRQLGFTPNGLTTISNVGAVMCLYGVYKKKPILIAVGFVIKYLFDCADGFFARKYKMTSKWGDKYDHYSDWIFSVLLLWVLWTKTSFQYWAFPYRGYIIAVFLFLGFMTWIHTGCQEAIQLEKNGETSETLSFSQKACPHPHQFIKVTRWFGSTIVPALFVLLCLLFVFE